MENFLISDRPLNWEEQDEVGSITLPVFLTFLPGRKKNSLHLTMGDIAIEEGGELKATASVGIAGGMQLSTVGDDAITLWVGPEEMARAMYNVAKSVKAKVDIERKERQYHDDSE